MAKEAANTGVGPIALIAIEQYFPKSQRIVEDDLAYYMLPSGSRIFAQLAKKNWIRNLIIQGSDRSYSGLWGGLLCRKRYIDDKFKEAIGKIEAIVNLGAGFDTRVYRLPVISDIPVWEVDQPVNINAKRARLINRLGKIPSHINLVPIDFDHDELETTLASNGYSLRKKTLFIMEAVTQYLTEKGIQATFDFLSKATSESQLIFTYIRKDFLDGRNIFDNRRFYNDFVAKKIFIYGFEPEEMPSFLKKYGWQLIEDLSYGELAEKYIKPTGRKFTSTPIERMVFAKKE